MAKLWPWEARAPKWHLAYFVPIDCHFGQVFEIWTFFRILGSKFFWRPKSKIAMISMYKIHIYIDSESFRQIEIWPLWWVFEVFWDRMANLGLIDFKLGLYIKVNVNNGKTSLKSISQKLGQNGHQLAQNRPDATLARALPMVITCLTSRDS